MPKPHSIESIEHALAPLGWNKARIKCLAAALVALLTLRSLNLKKIANLFPTDAKIDSAYKRLQRFLKDFHPDLDSLAKTLARLCGIAPPWHLSLDRTNWKLGKAHLNILMLCIVAGPISFPLLWVALQKEGKGKAGNSDTSERIGLMKRFVQLFGAESCACLRADREFASEKMLLFLEGAKLSYQLRLKADILVADSRGEMCCAGWLFRDCLIQQERVLGFRKVMGRVRFVSGTRLVGGDFLIVVSDLARSLGEYALRWGIEPMFGAFKSRGFDLEATHVTDPIRLSRLVCLLALAYTWAGVCGLWEFSLREWKVKKHGRLPISVFRLGLDFLQPIVARLCRNVSECQESRAIRFLSCT
jgi:hypothetical protein